LPASAHERAASASIDADPVSAAATDLAAATSTFTRNATSTVTVLAELPMLAAATKKSNDLRSAAAAALSSRESWPLT